MALESSGGSMCGGGGTWLSNGLVGSRLGRQPPARVQVIKAACWRACRTATWRLAKAAYRLERRRCATHTMRQGARGGAASRACRSCCPAEGADAGSRQAKACVVNAVWVICMNWQGGAAQPPGPGMGHGGCPPAAACMRSGKQCMQLADSPGLQGPGLFHVRLTD